MLMHLPQETGLGVEDHAGISLCQHCTPLCGVLPPPIIHTHLPSQCHSQTLVHHRLPGPLQGTLAVHVLVGVPGSGKGQVAESFTLADDSGDINWIVVR